MTLSQTRRGLTLLEVLAASALLAIMSICVMRTLGEGRELRARAADRSEMAMVAQSVLDQVRLDPTQLRGFDTKEILIDQGVRKTSVTLTVILREDRLSELTVLAERASVDGIRPVSLTTLVEVPR
jgi:prepilin-type N-terminal cleavage/methylation domain-containing protein